MAYRYPLLSLQSARFLGSKDGRRCLRLLFKGPALERASLHLYLMLRGYGCDPIPPR